MFKINVIIKNVETEKKPDMLDCPNVKPYNFPYLILNDVAKT